MNKNLNFSFVLLLSIINLSTVKAMDLNKSTKKTETQKNSTDTLSRNSEDVDWDQEYKKQEEKIKKKLLELDEQEQKFKDQIGEDAFFKKMLENQRKTLNDSLITMRQICNQNKEAHNEMKKALSKPS